MKTLLLATVTLATVTLAIAPPALAQGPGGPTPPKAPVTRAQALAEADRRFDAMDTNRDGKISPDERRVYRDSQQGRHGRDHKGRELTRDQFRERAAKRFDRVDTNRDGTIDANEREAARLLMRSRMAERQGD